MVKVFSETTSNFVSDNQMTKNMNKLLTNSIFLCYRAKTEMRNLNFPPIIAQTKHWRSKMSQTGAPLAFSKKGALISNQLGSKKHAIV